MPSDQYAAMENSSFNESNLMRLRQNAKRETGVCPKKFWGQKGRGRVARAPKKQRNARASRLRSESLQPGSHRFARPGVFDFLAFAHHGDLFPAYHDFRGQWTSVVGAGHHETIGPG